MVTGSQLIKMDSIKQNKLNQQLTSIAHELFTDKQFKKWVRELANQKKHRWYSLIVELDKNDCPIDSLKKLDESIYSKFVYQCIPSPDFNLNRETIILFNVSGYIWHSLIYYKST